MKESKMLSMFLGTAWHYLLIRGIISVILGILVIKFPAEACWLLAIFIGAMLIVNGVSGLLKARNSEHKTFFIVNALISICAGVFTLLIPTVKEIMLLVLVIIIAAWAIISGVARIILAFRNLNIRLWARILMGVAGIIFIGFGIVIVSNPGQGLAALALLFGIYLIFAGAFGIGMAFPIREMSKKIEKAQDEES